MVRIGAGWGQALYKKWGQKQIAVWDVIARLHFFPYSPVWEVSCDPIFPYHAHFDAVNGLRIHSLLVVCVEFGRGGSFCFKFRI